MSGLKAEVSPEISVVVAESLNMLKIGLWEEADCLGRLRKQRDLKKKRERDPLGWGRGERPVEPQSSGK